MFFEYPQLLWLELLLIPLIALYLWRTLRGRQPSLTVPDAAQWDDGNGRILAWSRHIPFILRMVALAALIVAIARPRSSENFEKVDTEGIDIVLTMDVSTSMLARDFKPDRIGAAKDIAMEFIASRPADRMGIVVFAGESYTQAPLTTDRATLINLMKEIETGLIDDGTAIGNGLASAVARLKDCGEVSPLMAAEIAKTYGVRVYTIGVGAMGEAPYPFMTPWGVQVQNVKVEIDEDLLRQIAEGTGGKYFRATNNTKLMEIYNEINQMEKTRTTVDSFPVYSELFMRFALIALAALLLELLFRFVILRRVP